MLGFVEMVGALELAGFIFFLSGGFEEARRLFEVTARPVDGESGEGSEGDEDAPDDVLREVGGEKAGGEEWADDEARGLHGEDERDEHAAMSLAGVLAHDGGGDRVVSADADAEDETEADEPPDAGGKGAGDSSCGKDEDFDSVDALAAYHVGDTAEEEGSDGGGEKRGGGDETFFDLADVPERLEEGHDDADDEQVVCVGEETHTGDEHDLPVLFGDSGVIHLVEVRLLGVDYLAHSGSLAFYWDALADFLSY